MINFNELFFVNDFIVKPKIIFSRPYLTVTLMLQCYVCHRLSVRMYSG